MKYFAIIICAAFTLFTSCDETKKVIDVAGSVQLSGEYVVTSIGDLSFTSKETQTIGFNPLNNQINGNSGCNTFFGTYALDLYAITFSGVGATKMMCPEDVMAKENAFFKAIGETGSYSLENGVLTLLSKTDRSVLLKAKKETSSNE